MSRAEANFFAAVAMIGPRVLDSVATQRTPTHSTPMRRG
jgi:hypothetical protein